MRLYNKSISAVYPTNKSIVDAIHSVEFYVCLETYRITSGPRRRLLTTMINIFTMLLHNDYNS